jgi:hypothetical protein
MKIKNERRFHLYCGGLIGLGIGMIVFGFVGWFGTNYLIGLLPPIFQEAGINFNQHYLSSRLNDLEIRYMLTMVGGIFSLLIGIIWELLFTREKRTK